MILLPKQKISLLLLIFITIFFPLSLYRNNPKNTLLAQLNILQQEAQIALIVTDLKHPKKPIFSINPKQYLQAASGMKLFTAIIAQHALPEVSPFSSIIGTTGQQKKDLLYGNVHLSIGANPTFDHQQLSVLLNALHVQGIRKINGDFLIHQYHFHDTYQPPGTLWNEVNHCYATTTADISFAKNCFLLTLVNLNNNIIQYNPEPSQPIQLNIKTQQNCNKQLVQLTHDPTHDRGVVITQNPLQTPEILNGCWYTKQPYWQFKRNLLNPEKTLRYHLRKNLKKLKIQLSGNIESDNAPIPNLQWHHKVPSPNLSTLLRTTLTKSDNHIANQLFIESAFQATQQTTSWAAAQAYAKQTLKHFSINVDNAHIIDGSGLSRNNRVTAEQLHTSLISIYQNDQLRSLISYLANPKNPESTLKSRLQDLSLPLYAKTGKIKGVISLSGFIDPFGNHPKAFTLIINGNNFSCF